MPSNFTENFNLSQWEPGDKVQRTDFNTDNAKIDTALTAQAQTLAAHTQALSKLSNCRVYHTTYVGNGVCKLENSPRVELPTVPDVLIVIGNAYLMYNLPGVESKAYILNGPLHSFFGIGWEGSTAILEQYTSNESLYMNSSNVTYHVLAFYQAE